MCGQNRFPRTNYFVSSVSSETNHVSFFFFFFFYINTLLTELSCESDGTAVTLCTVRIKFRDGLYYTDRKTAACIAPTLTFCKSHD